MDSDDFKAALGRFGSGVTIITAYGQGGTPQGFTASSFCSLSIDPPLVLFCLARDATAFQAFAASETFGVNILTRAQSDLSGRFAEKRSDKFDGVPLMGGEWQTPLLPGCLANLQCRTTQTFPGGDHLIVVGEVGQVHLGEGDPLIFHRGRYGTLGPTD